MTPGATRCHSRDATAQAWNRVARHAGMKGFHMLFNHERCKIHTRKSHSQSFQGVASVQDYRTSMNSVATKYALPPRVYPCASRRGTHRPCRCCSALYTAASFLAFLMAASSVARRTAATVPDTLQSQRQSSAQVSSCTGAGCSKIRDH